MSARFSPNISQKMADALHHDRSLSTSSLFDSFSLASPNSDKSIIANMNGPSNWALTDQQIALCRRRVALTLEINNQLLRFALIATGSLSDPADLSANPKTINATGKPNKGIYSDCVKRLHANIGYLLQINSLSSEDNTNENASPLNMFPQILTPPVEVPLLVEPYNKLQALFPEAVESIKQQLIKKIRQKQQQQQQAHYRKNSNGSSNVLNSKRANSLDTGPESPRHNHMSGMSQMFQSASNSPSNYANFDTGNAASDTMKKNMAGYNATGSRVQANNRSNSRSNMYTQSQNVNKTSNTGTDPEPGSHGMDSQVGRALVYKVVQTLKNMKETGDYSNLRMCLSALLQIGMSPLQLRNLFGNLGIDPQAVAGSNKRQSAEPLGSGSNWGNRPENALSQNSNNNVLGSINNQRRERSNVLSSINNQSHDNSLDVDLSKPDKETYQQALIQKMIQMQQAQTHSSRNEERNGGGQDRQATALRPFPTNTSSRPSSQKEGLGKTDSFAQHALGSAVNGLEPPSASAPGLENLNGLGDGSEFGSSFGNDSFGGDANEMFGTDLDMFLDSSQFLE